MRIAVLPLALLIGLAASTHPGFAAEPGDPLDEDIPRIEVIGKREDLYRIPGSGEVLDRETLEAAHVFSVNEALRKAATGL